LRGPALELLSHTRVPTRSNTGTKLSSTPLIIELLLVITPPPNHNHNQGQCHKLPNGRVRACVRTNR
jgi:hypothetical protein